MKFYQLAGCEPFAQYVGVTKQDDQAVDVKEAPRTVLERWREPNVEEYVGDPPSGNRKPGDYHEGAGNHFFSERARLLLASQLEDAGEFRPVHVFGREGEKFYRYWCTRLVDCLDLQRSEIRQSNPPNPNSIGWVKLPVFVEARWNGADVFRIPRDVNYEIYCSERFVDICRKHKIRGMQFSVGLHDPKPIRIR